MSMIAFLVLILTFAYIIYRNNYIFYGFIVVFNLTIVFLVGKYMVRTMLFPYSNPIIRRRLDSQTNRKFSLEFAK